VSVARAQRFLDVLSAAAPPAPAGNRLGRVAEIGADGALRVTFDGEMTAGPKGYTYLAPYAPAVGHRVLLVPVGASYVVAGQVLPTT
jgi:hypothetical protein